MSTDKFFFSFHQQLIFYFLFFSYFYFYLFTGYPSVRHSLLRMHSQLRSAPDRRETSQGGPIDLSLYRTTQQTPKMTTRSTSISTNTTTTTLRPIPIVASLATAPTHTIYSNAIPSSSSTSSQIATSIINHERPTKCKDDD
jgi:hypothetical protein